MLQLLHVHGYVYLYNVHGFKLNESRVYRNCAMVHFSLIYIAYIVIYTYLDGRLNSNL